MNNFIDINVVFFSCDDKVKVLIGEFGFVVSIGVRGKKFIVLILIIFVVGDYDMIKFSLILFVFL